MNRECGLSENPGTNFEKYHMGSMVLYKTNSVNKSWLFNLKKRQIKVDGNRFHLSSNKRANDKGTGRGQPVKWHCRTKVM